MDECSVNMAKLGQSVGTKCDYGIFWDSEYPFSSRDKGGLLLFDFSQPGTDCVKGVIPLVHTKLGNGSGILPPCSHPQLPFP